MLVSPRRYAQVFVLVLVLATGGASIAGVAAAADGDDAAPPTVPAGLTVTAVGQTSLTLAWTASVDHFGVAGYTVYKQGIAQNTTTTLAYDFTGLQCGATYSIAVDAYDAAGNHSAAATISVRTAACTATPPPPATTTAVQAPAPPPADTTAPSAPSGLTVTAASETSLTVAWGASTDTAGVTGYAVLKNGDSQGTTSSLNSTLAGLDCGTVYRIDVIAFDEAGNQSAAATISAATASCPEQEHPSTTTATRLIASASDTFAPSTPPGLTVTAAGQTSLTLAWGASTDAVGVAGYTVYKNAVAQGTTTQLTSNVSGLACGTTYSLAVDAYDAAGNHSVPAVISASTAACAPAPTPANVRVSPSGNDTTCVRGDDSRPCASLNRAYQVAQPGDLVSVDPGSYPAQRIDYDSSKSPSPVTFAPTGGGSVSLARLDVGQSQLNTRAAQHVVVRDMSVGFATVWDGAVDIVLQNLTARGFDIVYDGSSLPAPSDVRVVGGDYGPCEAVAQNGNCTNRMVGSNIVIDGANIHEVTSNDPARLHTDGIFMRGCQGCAVRNSKFWLNDVTNIRIQNCCSLPANQNITIENNSFGQPNDNKADAVDVDSATPGLVLRGNVFDPASGPLFDGGPYNGERLVQNKMRYLGPCVPGVSYEGNTVQPFGEFTGNVLCGTDAWGSWSF